MQGSMAILAGPYGPRAADVTCCQLSVPTHLQVQHILMLPECQ